MGHYWTPYIDDMAIVNKINIKTSKIKLCADFAEVFVDRILDESFGYNEVRVIFDRYVRGSLKAQTRIEKTGVTLQFIEYMMRSKLIT